MVPLGAARERGIPAGSGGNSVRDLANFGPYCSWAGLAHPAAARAGVATG